jgi:hypothetical protein
LEMRHPAMMMMMMMEGDDGGVDEGDGDGG